MGSKNRIAKELLAIILKDRGNRPYCEPFAGGMNMIQHVPQGSGRFANDNNRFLIAFWMAFISGWRPPEMTKELYQKCKSGDCSEELRGWAGFNCSYSGKWFGGYAGKVQTKGGLRDYIAEALVNCERQALNLKGVSFCSSEYDNISIPEDSIVYCDPPYSETTGYHSTFEHEKFWQWVREISKSHSVFVSEYKAPEDFLCVWEKSVKSSLSANGKSGSSIASVEKLFTLSQ